MADLSPSSGVDAALAGGRLTIDLAALVRNWRKLDALSAPARAAAVVKADAYGIGASPVVQALYSAGCRTFFVALPHEGVEVRKVAPDARIFVLTGAFSEDRTGFEESRLIPLLCSLDQVRDWLGSRAQFSSFGIHVDTGMNRLGLNVAEALALASEINDLKQAGLCHLMSHLACADDPLHPLNAKQRKAFQGVRSVFSGVESSLCNSAGIFLAGDYLCDMTRPGIALYGGEAVNDTENPMEVVVTAETRIVQIRHAKASETVSYGATTTLSRDTTIAVCATGYADGFNRASGSGVSLRDAEPVVGHGFVAGTKVPILGRVTMDLTMFDATNAPLNTVHVGDYVELFGKNIALDDAARAAGTIGYEFLTSLGRRYHRRYSGMA